MYMFDKYMNKSINKVHVLHIIQIYSGITCGRVLNGELCAQTLQKLIYLYR